MTSPKDWTTGEISAAKQKGIIAKDNNQPKRQSTQFRHTLMEKNQAK
jgi:hypothetical protein